MARQTRFSDKIQNARYENIELTDAEKLVQTEWDLKGGLSNYTKTNLQDMIDNFIIAYTGDGKILPKVPRHEVAFWGQRAVQEFSYDVLFAEKNIELELNPDTVSIALPSDYVNYVKVSYIDSYGNERTVHPSRIVNGKQAILQDDNYGQLYDETGTALQAEKSESLKRFQDVGSQDNGGFGRNYYYGSVYDGDYYNGYYNQYYGQQYGNDPQFENYNGTFVLDTYKGIIYFDSSFAAALNAGTGGFVSLRYVSDGLGDNDDLATVFIHKFAEDAIYTNILYNLAKLRPSAAQIAPLYKKEAKAKLNNAKIRLMNMKTEEMTQVMRGRAKWIKH